MRADARPVDAARRSKQPAITAPALDVSIVIDAPASRVLKAFFEPEALDAWWQVAHAVTTPRAARAYAIEWAPTEFRDEVLGRLGGVFRGTVMQFDPGPRASSSPMPTGCRPTATRSGRWRSR